MRTAIRVAYWVMLALLLVLLAMHRSETPVVFGYSARYGLILVGTALIGSAVPWLPGLIRSRFSTQQIVFSLVPASVLVVFLYVAGSVQFYHSTRVRLFDPFLQIHPTKFNAGAKPRGAIRIVTMGGSTTLESDYPSLLEVGLRQRYSERDIEVFNAGMTWWTSKHSLINYVTNLSDLDADVVTVMHGFNDLTRSFSPDRAAVGEYQEDYGHYYGPAIYAARRPTFERLLVSPFMGFAHSCVHNTAVDFPLERYRSLGQLRRHLDTIAEIVHAGGARLVLLTQPSIYRDGLTDDDKQRLIFKFTYCGMWSGFLEREYPSVSSMAMAMQAANDVVREVAERHGALLVDVAPTIPRDWDHFVDDIHHIGNSGQLIGEAVATSIAESDWLQPLPSSDNSG